jgi:hypothetical protein
MGPKLKDMSRRLHALEERVGDVEDGLARTRRVLDSVTKSCNVLIQGSDSVEELWLAHGPGEQYDQLNRGLARALVTDLCVQLERPYPPSGGNRLEPVTGALCNLLECLEAHGTVTGVFAQYKKAADDGAAGGGERTRIEGTFRVRLTFGANSLLVQNILKTLDHPLRRKAGLPVAGVAPEEDAAMEGAPPKKLLVFLERTATERADRKGKGKGKGGAQKGKGKGKGRKGKHKASAKGRGEAAAAAGAAGGAAAAPAAAAAQPGA